jgi:hypothetical protein
MAADTITAFNVFPVLPRQTIAVHVGAPQNNSEITSVKTSAKEPHSELDLTLSAFFYA